MRFHLRLSLLIFPFLLHACTATAPPRSPLLHSILQLNPDGTRTALPENLLTPFQRFIRTRLPRPPAQQVTQLFLLEVDVPPGTGFDGAYLVVALFPQGAEFEYFEQSDHLPRNDRYFHRRLTPAELTAFLDFTQLHPIETLRSPPSSAPAPPAPNLPPPAAPPDATEPQPDSIVFRFTDARPKEARTIFIPSPTADDHPAIDLIRQFSNLRDATDVPPLVCSYILQIPATSEILFADPQRHVLDLWFGPNPEAADPSNPDATGPNELRAQVYPPLDFSFADFSDETKLPEPRWYAYRDSIWVPCAAPPAPKTQSASQPATRPATEPTSQPATGPASRPLFPRLRTHAFTLPDNMDLSRLTESELPIKETWLCQPAEDHTLVWHYLPIDEHHGQWLGFVVPVFVFDDDHTRFDAPRRKCISYMTAS